MTVLPYWPNHSWPDDGTFTFETPDSGAVVCLTLFLATQFHSFHIEEIIGLENDLLTNGANCFRITAFEFKISRTISAALCHLCLLTELSVVPTTYIFLNVTLHGHVWLSGVKS